MCQNAEKKVYDLGVVVEASLKSLLGALNLLTTEAGTTVINAFDAILADLKIWQSGSTAQNIIQLLTDFQGLLSQLPIRSEYVVLLNIVLGGVEAIIGMLTGNSPAPAPEGVEVAPDTIDPDTQEAHAVTVAATTAAKINVLVPDFKPSVWHTPATQYNTAWNNAVDTGAFPPSLKV